ncbi:MAG: T9SS type A sorting domain-containing protein [Crocinitomicaceae bacterium]|nr:T9SS type A sorting domain-containing protein [Crocinitomicaceae bacterium]
MHFSAILTLLFILSSSIPIYSQYLGGYIDYNIVQNGEYDFRLYTFSNSSISVPDSIFIDDGYGVTFYSHLVNTQPIENGFNKNTYEFNVDYLNYGSFITFHFDTNYSCNSLNLSLPYSYYLAETIYLSPFFNSDKPLQYKSSACPTVIPGDTLKFNPIGLSEDNFITSYEYRFSIFNPAIEIPSGISINPSSGEFTWITSSNTPQGYYDFLLKVEKFPNGIENMESKIHFSVFVEDTIPSKLEYAGLELWQRNSNGFLVDTVEVNSNIQRSFSISHPGADSINILPFSDQFLGSNNATVNVIPNGSNLTMNFSWTPTSLRASAHPYLFYYKNLYQKNGINYYNYLTHMIFVTNSTTASIDENFGDNSFVVFPNPAKNSFKIKAPKHTQIEIFNSFGQVRLKGEIENEKELKIECSKLSSGVYFVIFNHQNTRFVEKLIIE